MSFSIDGIAHDVGSEQCGACEYGMPLGPCSFCAGQVHTQVIDHFNEITINKCDRCGK